MFTKRKKLIFNTKYINSIFGPTEELIIEDTDIKWDADDFGHEEISEEDQARLLEQYEAEILEREKRKSQEEKVTFQFEQNCYYFYFIIIFLFKSLVQQKLNLINRNQKIRKSNKKLNKHLKKEQMRAKNRM